MNKIKIVGLVGKAGAGKDCILRHLMERRPDLHEIVSCTSRPPREGEINGVNYYFHTKEEFLNKIVNKEMLEHALFRDWYYGTSLDGIDPNKTNVGVFNLEGINNLLANPNIELQVFYIWADDKTRLLRQLSREENPDVKEIIRRFGTDETDFERFSHIIESEHCHKIINNAFSLPDTCALLISDRID